MAFGDHSYNFIHNSFKQS